MAGQSHPAYPNPFGQEPGGDPNHAEQNAAQVLTPYGEQQLEQEMERERIRREADLLRAERALIFTDKSIRMSFIRKVYSILTMQLVIVACITVLIFHNKTLRVMLQTNFFVIIGLLIVHFGSVCVLACCQSIARSSPMNYILLFVFTVSSGFFVALAAVHYRIDVVMIAVGITAVICFSVTIFACQTSIDFTVYGGMFGILLMVFCFVGIILSFFSVDRPYEIIFAGIGVVIFSFILLHDTQLMLGGNHAYSFTPEDYVFAALCLYLDVINIFLFVLQMLGGNDD